MYKAALYTRANDLQRTGVSQISDEFINEIGKMSGHCLDIGSGPGDTVVDFILPKLNAEANLVCSDISENMVNFGKEKYKDNQRLSFVELDIETPDLPKDMIGYFDHITSFYCLHWCQNIRQVFENIHNLLRPGGTTLLTFIATSPVCGAYEVLAAMPQYQHYMKDVDRYISVFQHVERPCATLEALLEVVGFEIYHCSVRVKNTTFKSPDALEAFLLALNPFIDHMPTELGKKYMEDLCERSCETEHYNQRN